ncbi:MULTISPECIES: hypothetical protein [Rhodococcus]|uniref:Uncharacterized protein n=1 Tax=Rhodococcus opacus RKJ300 = JCM 13270 TaxID=1165867 RepID=I0WDK8_RHOOP|nr:MULTISPECIES: hypothetical protein [Rhodococcus]EID74474.1 hypothetical protein W59_29864 [Rhodococcus opacus RKJ300 = JCM 13270]QQZ18443.1 hypothetical protein GO592_40395 [Rhodococcus sp. 21391]
MAVASVGRVDVQALVPRGLDGPAVERVRAAVGRPLAEAVPDAFALLEEIDPGACWLLRSVHLDVRVPASEPDPARHAAAIARAMAAAVERVVHDGPSADAVRFAGRPAYVAAYVGAVLDGHTASWVFDGFRALDGLRASDALVAAARSTGAGLLDVVAALVAAGRWGRLLDRATPSEAVRLSAAVGRLHATSANAAALAEAWARRSAWSPVGGSVTPTHAVERRLRLLGEVVSAGMDPCQAVAAVWAVEPAASAKALEEIRTFEGAAEPGPAADTAVGDSQALDEHAPAAEVEMISMGDRLSAVGSVAFLLAPDLDDLFPEDGPGDALAGATRAAGDARALLLAAVLGRETTADDPAVRLAAGAEPRRREQDTDDVCALLDPLTRWLDELGADEILGWRHSGDDEWFAPLAAVDARLALVGRALLRRFAAHLPGFGRSGAAYLAERLLPLGGSVRLDEDAVVVELPRPQLHVLLALACLDAFTYRCRWMAVPVVVVHEAD